MVSLVSRTGRQSQRYNRGCRQVVGCIPYRIRKPTQSSSIDGSFIDDLEVLLISSQKSQKMMFPKGGWEIDETMKEAAVRETLEEAGVIGNIEYELGKWSYYNSKGNGTSHEGYMFPLLVKEELDHWPEKDVRQRKWITAAQAREVSMHVWMKEALEMLIHRLEKLRQKEEQRHETPSTKRTVDIHCREEKKRRREVHL